jgi:hypothetical protein
MCMVLWWSATQDSARLTHTQHVRPYPMGVGDAFRTAFRSARKRRPVDRKEAVVQMRVAAAINIFSYVFTCRYM